MSTSPTLVDAKQSADLYLDEAEQCASGSSKSSTFLRVVSKLLPAKVLSGVFPTSRTPKILGFAAMSLSLACVVSIGEALVGRKKPPGAECIKAFCKEMQVFDWLLWPKGQTRQQTPADLLYRVRNALIHALSLPDTVCLVPTREIYYATYSARFEIGIVPSLFVTAVKKTIEDIAKRRPQLGFDLSSSDECRSPVKVDPSPTSGSLPS